ncbi:PAS domain-containing sensor histidine kinase [Pontibacter pamirensis]|uniref:PAS domain-containing sensor histidine kinase n=1 Tax=Pontibacter pamirensis TaxID=2562824 RepID=UPI001389CB90|nr:PAS domain-containing sensor histidine kinase [Pontibacter pamirensis]
MKGNNTLGSFFIEQVAQQFGQVYFSYDTISSAFTYIAPAFEQLWGIKPENVTSPTALLSYIHADDREFLTHQCQKLLLTREQAQAEFRIVQPDQRTKWIGLSVCFLRSEKGSQHLIGGYAEDITADKEYTHNILKYNNKKNSTLEILSHDLAAPFANIQSAIHALEEQVAPEDPDTRKLIDFIRQDAIKGSDMIRDFVDQEFLESSQVVLHKEQTDIANNISIMVDNYIEREKLVNKHFKLISPEKPVYIYVDMMKFMQVMNNLVSNAIKFTHDNGSITVSVEDSEDHVLLTVADDGIGIPPKVHPYLFDRFTKARRAGLRGEKTTGLGMSIIQTIVELHGGKITFESQENVGTTFYIRMPKD